MVKMQFIILCTLCLAIKYSKGATITTAYDRIYALDSFWQSTSKRVRSSTAKNVAQCTDFAGETNPNAPFAFDPDAGICEVIDVGTKVKIFTRYETKEGDKCEIYAPKRMLSSGECIWPIVLLIAVNYLLL